MQYRKLIGAGVGAGLFYLLTGSFWATLVGGLVGGICGYYADKQYDDNHTKQTADLKSTEETYPNYFNHTPTQ